jgi:hypothetical protein
MGPIFSHVNIRELATFIARLEDLYARMDRAYGEMAQRYRLSCEGCEDNCCTTRFLHHTASEFIYLLRGFDQIGDEDLKQTILERAERHSMKEGHTCYICPLHEEGLCLLYPYRTMICRLHGVPYSVRMPDGRITLGPGCRRFYALPGPGASENFRLDRTPFYAEMAAIERDLRAHVPYPHGLRLTIAEMLWFERGG